MTSPLPPVKTQCEPVALRTPFGDLKSILKLRLTLEHQKGRLKVRDLPVQRMKEKLARMSMNVHYRMPRPKSLGGKEGNGKDSWQFHHLWRRSKSTGRGYLEIWTTITQKTPLLGNGVKWLGLFTMTMWTKIRPRILESILECTCRPEKV